MKKTITFALCLILATCMRRRSASAAQGVSIQGPLKHVTSLLGLAIVLASVTAGRATTDSCAVVLNTPDGFLALREGPGTQFRIKDKLSPGQTVDITTEDCRWHANDNVTCSKWIELFRLRGWVRSKYIQPLRTSDGGGCPSEPLYGRLPPKKYDHPYKGRVIIERVNNYDDMSYKCDLFNGHPNGKPKGCVESERHGVCRITIVSDAVAISLGYDPKILLRHEIGHCNGWSGDHRGARVIGVDPD